MKKVLLICGLFVFVLSASAQKVSLGLKASPGIAWIKPDTKGLQSDGAKIGFSYGAIVDFMFTENYGLGSGLFIQHQGGKLDYEQAFDSAGIMSVITSRQNYKLQYLNIPVTLKMRTNEIGYFRYYGQFGLSPGILLGAKGTTEVFGTKTDLDDAKDNINSFNVALVVGAGAMYNFSGNTSLIVGLEWNNGFSDAFKGADLKGKNNFLLINLGVIF